MKKLLFTAAAFAVIFASSCTKENVATAKKNDISTIKDTVSNKFRINVRDTVSNKK